LPREGALPLLRIARRLVAEIRHGHDAVAVDAALASLTVRTEDDVAIVTREAGSPLFGAPPLAKENVRIERGVYARTPSAAARVHLLETAAAIAPRIEVHVPTVSDGTHRGRLAIDVPRRVARAIGLATAEPGDRFERGFTHAFFDDEAIVEEAARAGLRFVARRGAWVVLEREGEKGGAAPPEQPAATTTRPEAFSVELVRALALVREAEGLRLGGSPERAVRVMRERGRRATKRGTVGRARLRRAVGWVDAAFPGGPNCFRRTLVEVGLDAGAAGETLVFGLDVGRTGHVSFKDSEDRSFDVAFEVPADRG
jgi:hypothetical protein